MVLKWYRSILDQEHRKDYAHGVVPVLQYPINILPPFQLAIAKGENVSGLEIISFKDNTETDILSEATTAGLTVLEIENENYDNAMYPSTVRLTITDFDKGGYYLRLTDSANNIFYSEVFTLTDNIAEHIKLVWCHNRDFQVGGRAVFRYTNTGGTGNGYKNYVYLDTYIVKPQYEYERDVRNRDGKVFPLKQIRKKVHRFEVIAQESILDALSLVELHDVVKLYDRRGYEMKVEEITMGQASWLGPGNIAAVTFSVVSDISVSSVYGNGLQNNQTCEVAPGGCVGDSDPVYVAKSILQTSDPGWAGGYYYNSSGVKTNLIADDYVISGDFDSRLAKLYKYVSAGVFTEEAITVYSWVYVLNADKYYYDRGGAFNLERPEITGFTDLTTPDTFYGRCSDALTELWLEDAGGAQIFVKSTTATALNLGEQVDTTGYTKLVIKTVTPLCGTIHEHKFDIPISYVLITNVDNDFTTVISNVDDDLSILSSNLDIPSIPEP